MHQSFRHAHLPYRVTSLILLLCPVAAELCIRTHQYLPLPLVPQFYRFELLPPSRLPLRTSTKFLYTHISIQCLLGGLIHVLTALLDQPKIQVTCTTFSLANKYLVESTQPIGTVLNTQDLPRYRL